MECVDKEGIKMYLNVLSLIKRERSKESLKFVRLNHYCLKKFNGRFRRCQNIFLLNIQSCSCSTVAKLNESMAFIFLFGWNCHVQNVRKEVCVYYSGD